MNYALTCATGREDDRPRRWARQRIGLTTGSGSNASRVGLGPRAHGLYPRPSYAYTVSPASSGRGGTNRERNLGLRVNRCEGGLATLLSGLRFCRNKAHKCGGRVRPPARYDCAQRRQRPTLGGVESRCGRKCAHNRGNNLAHAGPSSGGTTVALPILLNYAHPGMVHKPFCNGARVGAGDVLGRFSPPPYGNGGVMG